MQNRRFDERLNGAIKSWFSIYGAGVSIENRCAGGGIIREIDRFLNPFQVRREMCDGISAHGMIREFELDEVMHSLSSAGASRRCAGRVMDIYSTAERHWVFDDRWGVCEIDLLKHRWRSWIVRNPMLDVLQLVEAAVIWPMAQLLRLGEIELAQVISIERGGWGALVIAPYPIAREITRLVRAGYRVIGQRWTALVRQNGRIAMRHIPGMTESPAEGNRLIRSEPIWTDVTEENPWAAGDVAWCDAVLSIAPGRRSRSCGRVMGVAEAQKMLRRAWPICELPVNRPRLRHPAGTLAEQCVCLNVQLSRHEDEFLDLVEFARLRSSARAQVSISGAIRRRFVAPAMRVETARLAG